MTAPLEVSMLACQWVCMENAFARYLNAGVAVEDYSFSEVADVDDPES